MNRSVKRTEPMSTLTWKSSSRSSVEPPPMSSTSVCGFGCTPPRVRPAPSPPPTGRGAGEPPLFVAAGEPRCESIAPFDPPEKRLAVLCIAHGARRNEKCALRSERFERAAVVGAHVATAWHRHGEEAPARVNSFAEPRDLRLAVHILHVPVDDVGD